MFADASAFSGRNKQRRNGGAVVEFAIVAPLLILLVFGLIEYARIEMVLQTMNSAAQEACRAGVVPGSTSADVSAAASDSLKGGLVSSFNVSVAPAEVATLKAGDTFSVTVQVPIDKISWLPSPIVARGKQLKAQCTMRREAR